MSFNYTETTVSYENTKSIFCDDYKNVVYTVHFNFRDLHPPPPPPAVNMVNKL